ncbi:hypothetical protein LguiA_000322 [Lonicera macranthoides]
MALGSLLAWLRVLEEVFKSEMIDEVKTPNLFKWALRFCSDDAVKDVMPRHDRLLEFVVNLIGAWPSPFVNRVRLALKLKSIDYVFLQENFVVKSELLLKSNPIHKKIPVLIHHDKPICESLIIVQYIDEVWSNNGPTLLPSDPYDRAIACFWAAYIDDKLVKAIDVAVKSPDAKKKKAAMEEISPMLAVLEEAFVKCSKGKAFFGGDIIGYVDIAMGPLWGWLKVIESINKLTVLDEATIPNLLKWGERFYNDATVKDVIPQHEKLLDVIIKVFPPMLLHIPSN